MTAYGTVIEPGTIRFERVLDGPPETVWAYLVESEKRAAWLAGGEMDLREGGAVDLVFNNAALCEPGDEAPEKYRHESENASMRGRVTACRPLRLLSYTWVEPEEGIDEAQASEVTFELTPQNGKTLLVLTHRRLKPGEQMEGVAAGWHTHLAILLDRVRGSQPASFWSTFTPLEAVYRQRLGAA